MRHRQLPQNLGDPIRSNEESRWGEHIRLLPAIFLAAGLLTGCGSTGKAANPPTAAVVTVQRHDLASELSIASEFQPYQEVNVYAKVSGYIQKLYVDWGAHVKQGQLLAVLEIPELQQQLQQDEAGVKKSEQDLARAREELNRAESAYTVAHLTYSRLADVQKSRPELVAQEEIDVAQGKDLEASAGASAAKDSLAASEQELLASKAALEKDRAMYAYARITAPFDGVVTEIDAYTGALLPAGTSSNKGDQTLCHLSQNDLLRLVIPVPERAVADVHVGESVAVHVTTINKTFDGKIALFSGQIDPETRTLHTEVTVPNPKYEIVPGMYATVQIPLHTVQNVLTVPVQAVQASGEGRGAVLVVGSDNRIEKRDVSLGLESATDVEIVSGLRENERVVFGEQSQYKPGDLVAPKIVTPSGLE
jgi:RND family efflux transporter MFP subunit